MGLFDIFGGGTALEKAQKQKSKITQKFGDPLTRQKAIQTVIKLKDPSTLPVLMQRFTFNVDPQTTDRAEKDEVFEAICALEKDAVPQVVEFLSKSEQASSWAVKVLNSVLPPPAVVDILVGELNRLGTSYTRDPEKKQVLLHALEELGKTHPHPEILTVARHCLSDMSDDVKMTALKTIASLQAHGAEPDIVNLIVSEDIAKRVQVACYATLAEAGFVVETAKEKVRALLPPGYLMDKAGRVSVKA
jgi:hypothetical protein